ncbi:MAG: hypothetical protein NC122_10090 [Faecalibacterium sp.]|nr:hypothetical protein [Ruminococcus sp.]MCM1486540.1 hypothetical protein [Faecalibacterium sp.]
MKRKILALVLTVIIALSCVTVSFAATPVIKKTAYKGSGVVEVDFQKNVQYKNVKVTVKDSNKKSYTVTIKEKDSDDIKFYVKSIKSSTKYTYSISGVRSGKSGNYVTVSGSFTTPAASTKLTVKKAAYDSKDKELELDFSAKVQYKNLKVTVKDSAGKTYTTKVVDKDDDELDISVKGLAAGKKYTYTVSGIRKKGASSYGSLTGTFTTPAASTKLTVKKAAYDSKDKELELDFSAKVQYKNLKVTVKDSAGKTYTTKVVDKDDDELDISVKGLAAGKKYTYTVSGIRKKGASSYGSLTGTFTTPAASTKPTIKSAKYDREDKELEVDFSTKVQYKNLKVTVKDSKGKSYTVKITEKENDSLELRVTLTKGTKYTVTVSGVSLYNKGNYVSVSKTFTA